MAFGETCTFNEAVEFCRRLPITWYGPLIKEMVTAAYEKDVFIKGGASNLVSALEKEIKQDAKTIRKDKK